ncbi:MAG: tRNA dihydrouridine synthase DusB [Clostridiales bacterium]|nr:tRNA dihydrouridine synthase DusB [Clostridiales bacterium]
MKVYLAPMAGVTNRPFRLLCNEQGCDITVTEMISAKALSYNNARTLGMLETNKYLTNHYPLTAQFFGREPALMANAARIAESMGFDAIDVNMGCPAPKIVKNGEGSALLKEPALAGLIVEAMSKAVTIPVSAKIRSGYDANHINAVEIAKILESSGASSIVVHPRTKDQFYHGKADWHIIKSVKLSVEIPVIANGDIDSPEAARAVCNQTNCDGVMIGRAALGNPWIFSRVKKFLSTGELLPEPSANDKINMALRHCAMMKDKIFEMRKHVSWYIKTMEGATAARVAINSAVTLKQMENILTELGSRANHTP